MIKKNSDFILASIYSGVLPFPLEPVPKLIPAREAKPCAPEEKVDWFQNFHLLIEAKLQKNIFPSS